MPERLAIHGGEPAVRVSTEEGWQPPFEEQKRAVGELIDQRYLSGAGEGVSLLFEQEFAAYTGASYCLAVDHGSNALMAGLYAVGVGPGDEVIVPSRGYIGSYAGALHLGAKPVFCDCCADNALIDPADVEKRITPRTRAIIPIHFNGTMCDMDGLLDLLKRYGVAIVHDACHAHPARWDGASVGALPDVVCFSLQGADPDGKPVCGGEGGIITTNNREFYERVLIYSQLHRHGIEDELTNPVRRAIGRQGLGFKWRPHPLAMALARISLQSVDYRNRRRLLHRDYLYERLANVPGIHPSRSYGKSQDGGFYGGYRVIYAPEDLGLDARSYQKALRAEGVPISFYRDGPEHLRYLVRQGYDLWGHGRGPIPPGTYDYKPGDLPVTEAMLVEGRAMRIKPYIEPADGLLDQIVAAFTKVADWYLAHSE